MLWKKQKEKEAAVPETKDTPQVALWDSLTKDILDFYASTRDHLVKMERWDVEQAFLSARRATLINDLQKAVIRIRDSFQDARKKEVAQNQRYAVDLRSLIWASVDQICSLMDSSVPSAKSISRAKESLQKALNQNDLEIAKKSMREMLNALSELDRDRQFTIRSLQMNFQNHVGFLQSELRMMRMELQLDGLTHVYNRATFDEQIKKVAQLSYVSGEKACLVMLDIDHFKQINDSHGHPVGDQVIQACAKTVVQSFPRKDDFVARYGGEEFALIISGVSLAEAQDQVQRLLDRIRAQRISVGQQSLSFTISAGIAAYCTGENVGQWLARADKALYKAKQDGRNRSVLAPEADESKAS